MEKNTTIKTVGEIDAMRAAGKVVALALDAMREAIEGPTKERSTLTLDRIADDVLRANKAASAFKGYIPPMHQEPFPFTTCISVNNEVVHGLPSELKVLKDGDVVKLDCGACVDGWYADAAISVGVGKIESAAYNIMLVTRQALKLGVFAAQPGNTLGDIGFVISAHAKKNRVHVAQHLTGHFIGRSVHEAPEVPNYGDKGAGMKLEPGMVFCIEPMFNVGTEQVYSMPQGFWAIVTGDGSGSAHYEHTVLVTDNGPEILTKL